MDRRLRYRRAHHRYRPAPAPRSREAAAAAWEDYRSDPSTPWGGPVGLGEDPDGGCFPEGNVERQVLDSFDRTVNVNWWVTVRPTSAAPGEARRLAGELRWWHDMFGVGASAIRVVGAIEGIAWRALGGTALSGVSVVAGKALKIDIPTDIRQVPLVILERAAAMSAAIIDAWGGWIESNHVEHVGGDVEVRGRAEEVCGTSARGEDERYP